MKDLKIYYEIQGTMATRNNAFEVEVLKLAKKFGLRFVRDHFDSVNRIRMVYFKNKNL